MRKIYSVISGLTLLVLLTSVNFVFSQSVGISITGPFTPNTSALLDVSATSKGVLIPRVALTGVNDATTIISPATSLLVYNDGTGGLSTAGYYYNSGTSGAPNWIKFMTGSGTAWDILGNSGTSVANNFIGTTDNVSLAFRTNNSEKMRLWSGGQLTLSYYSGTFPSAGPKLDVHQDGSNDVAIFTTYGNPNNIRLRRTGGDQLTPTATSGQGTIVGRIFGEGYQSAAPAGFINCASINFEIDANNSGLAANDMPGRIVFYTTPDGSGTLSERMKILQTGCIYINKTTLPSNPSYKRLYVSQAQNGSATSPNYDPEALGSAIMGTNTTSGSWGFGVVGSITNNNTRTGGVIGVSNNNSIWGSLGYRNSGGTDYGAYYSSTGGGLGTGTGFMPNSDIQGIGYGSYGGVMGGWTRGDVLGQTNMGELYASYNMGNQYTSGVSADIVTNNNERTPAYSVTSNDVKVYSDGKAKLINGSCKVTFDRSFLQLLSQQENPTITVSALGECAGLYIVSFEKDGFTVKEFHNGQSNVEFTWIAIGKRVDADKVSQLPDVVKDIDFDANMKRVMFNENNTEKSGLPIWWDGSKLRFDTPPVHNSDSKKN